MTSKPQKVMNTRMPRLGGWIRTGLLSRPSREFQRSISANCHKKCRNAFITAHSGLRNTPRANEEIRITQQQKIEEDQKRADEAPGNLEMERQQQQAVLAKAQSIRIPYIEFRDVTVREAVDFLVAQGKDIDPGGTGVIIGMSLNDTEPKDQPIPRITLLLQDVTLFQAVTAVAQQIGLSVNVVDIGLYIYCKQGAPFYGVPPLRGDR
jgi:hypothetical protein